MVTDTPTTDELFGQDDTPTTPLGLEEFIPTTEEIDEQMMLVAILALYLGIYQEYQYKSPDYVISHLPASIKELEEKVQRTTYKELETLTTTFKTTVLEGYGIHKRVMPQVPVSFDLKGTLDVVKSSVTGTLNQLRDDIITKAQVFKDTSMAVKDFNLQSNFKRAINRTKRFVKFNAQTVKQKVTRGVQKFVYGAAMKYFWVVSGRRTCEKCYALARLPPATIDQWPLDHPNGGCTLKPESDKTTTEYQGYLEESRKYTNITTL